MSSVVRKGCKDVWNAYMVEGATWDYSDIPLCPTTAEKAPARLISYTKARALVNKALKRGRTDFHINAFVHFYLDDYRFVGKSKGFWNCPEEAIRVIKMCDGMITPDFSTYADFPDPIKRDATYKMRAFGFYASTKGVAVINNVRWGTCESWKYCFSGIALSSIVAIGTVASDIRRLDNRPLFEAGLMQMVETLKPKVIIVYGSANNDCFDRLAQSGIEIVSFPSERSESFKRVDCDE